MRTINTVRDFIRIAQFIASVLVVAAFRFAWILAIGFIIALATIFSVKLSYGAELTPVAALTPAQKLGYALAADRRMSFESTTSCLDCHDQAYGWSDGRRVAVGLINSSRSRTGFEGEFNTPTLIGRHHRDPRRPQRQFYDQRASSLFSQCLMPTQNNIEMDMPSISFLVNRIDGIAGYKPMFRAAFGSEQVSADRMRAAIASFIGTIKSEDAPADRLLAGETVADGEIEISAAAERGFARMSAARCFECHVPETDFQDDRRHRTGIAQRTGRGQINSVKTPTLREIQRSAPYMRDGSLTTLRSVVDFYASGGSWLDRSGQVRSDAQADPRVKAVARLQWSEDDRNDVAAALTECFRGSRYTQYEKIQLPE